MHKKCLIFSLLLFFFSFNLFSNEYVKCRILNVSLDTNIKRFQINLKKIELVKVKVLSEKYANRIIYLQNYIWKYPENFYNINVKKDDIVIANISKLGNKNIAGYVAFHHRNNRIIPVVLLFFLILFLVVKRRALKIITALLILYGLLFFVFIPLVKSGVSPILLSFGVSVVGTIITYALVIGKKWKIIMAASGTLIGLIFVYIATHISYKLAHISGLATYAGRTLNILTHNLKNFHITSISDLFISGVIIAGLGAIMDIAVDTAAAIYEIQSANKKLKFTELLKKGFNVSKKITGTMVNTLFFASFSGIIVYLIVFYIMKTPVTRYSNMEFFIINLIPVLTTSIGLVLTAPLTVLVGSFLLTANYEKKIFKLFLLVFSLVSIFYVNYNLYGWISPPDKELYRHPITKMYKYRHREEYVYGKTEKIIKEKNMGDFVSQDVKMKLLGGWFKNKSVIVKNFLWGSPNDIIVKKHSRAVVWIQKENNKIKRAIVIERYRFFVIYYLAIALLIFLILFAGFKYGIRIFLSLLFSIGILIFIFIPLITKGFPIIFTTIGINFFILLVIIAALAKDKKMFMATLASSFIGGIFIYIFAFIIGKYLSINGSSIESVQFLNYFNYNFNGDIIKNIKYIIYSVVLFGATGALTDISISIYSSLDEIKQMVPDIKNKKLFTHGMNIGKDISGTMVNTLFLAYTGLNIGFIFIWSEGNNAFTYIFNLEFVSVEITKAVAGSIGFILTIPVISFITAYFINKRKMV